MCCGRRSWQRRARNSAAAVWVATGGRLTVVRPREEGTHVDADLQLGFAERARSQVIASGVECRLGSEPGKSSMETHRQRCSVLCSRSYLPTEPPRCLEWPAEWSHRTGTSSDWLGPFLSGQEPRGWSWNRGGVGAMRVLLCRVIEQCLRTAARGPARTAGSMPCSESAPLGQQGWPHRGRGRPA